MSARQRKAAENASAAPTAAPVPEIAAAAAATAVNEYENRHIFGYAGFFLPNPPRGVPKPEGDWYNKKSIVPKNRQIRRTFYGMDGSFTTSF